MREDIRESLMSCSRLFQSSLIVADSESPKDVDRTP